MSKLKTVVETAGAWDWAHDPWGTTMMLFFDIAAALDASDIEGDATPAAFTRWGYRRGAAGVPSLETLAESDESYGAAALAEAILADDLTQADLIYVGDVLSRYSGILKAAGRDY